VGIVEQMDESLVLAEHGLGGHFEGLDLSHAPQNVSRETDVPLQRQIEQIAEQLGDGVMSELLHRNALDFELHAIATRQHEARMAEVPDVEGRLRDFRRRCSLHERGTASTVLTRVKRVARGAP
jgi:hypothetical protein